MNLEYAFQSVPFNCGLLEMAKTRPIFGEFLELYGLREISYEAMLFRSGDEHFAAYNAETKRLRDEFPGIGLRRVQLGASRDRLIDAFGHARNDLLKRAVEGGDILGVSICSTRGVPLSYLPPYQVKSIANEFDRIPFESILNGNRPAGAEMDALSSDHEKLADFYRFAAAFDEGVVMIAL